MPRSKSIYLHDRFNNVRTQQANDSLERLKAISLQFFFAVTASLSHSVSDDDDAHDGDDDDDAYICVGRRLPKAIVGTPNNTYHLCAHNVRRLYYYRESKQTPCDNNERERRKKGW